MWPSSVDKSQLKIDSYRGSGPGGQHRNKTDSAVRITHIPTGISASSETDKSQHRNKKLAFQKLAEKLVPIMKQKLEKNLDLIEQAKRIRSYHEPNGRVTDHVTGKTYSYKDVVHGKGLDKIYEAR